MSLVSEVSDRVLALNYGRVLALGTPAEVQSHPDVVKAYLGA
jgi:branched-chain amino acid transport system ATP-binding protein